MPVNDADGAELPSRSRPRLGLVTFPRSLSLHLTQHLFPSSIRLLAIRFFGGHDV